MAVQVRRSLNLFTTYSQKLGINISTYEVSKLPCQKWYTISGVIAVKVISQSSLPTQHTVNIYYKMETLIPQFILKEKCKDIL